MDLAKMSAPGGPASRHRRSITRTGSGAMSTSSYRVLIPFLALALAACGGDDAAPGLEGGPPVPGGTAVIGVLNDFSGFNPVTNTSIATDEVIKQMLFTPLVRYDEELEPQPFLAESWELSDTSVTFTLRDDVTWHDGRPVTAEDVKFTFDLAKDPATASLLNSAYLNLVDGATVVDSRTIHFSFEIPHSQALENFWWAPLPKHLLENVPASELAQAPFNQEPVGSGPFRFVSWTPNQELVLEANPAFAEELGGRPHLDRVVFRVIPEATTMVTELLSGSADVIGYTLFPDQARQLEGQDQVRLEHFPSREFTYVGWNNARPIFQDATVRRALAMALDRTRFIEALMHGYGTPAAGMIPPWSPMYTEVDPLPHAPDQARQLLAQAGWRDANGDGIVEKNGQPFRFTLLANAANQLHQDVAAVIQQQLGDIGVGVEIRTLEFQTLLRQHKERDYDAVIANWTLDNFKIDPTPLFSCAQARIPESANRAGFCDPAIDELITRGVRTTDPAAAKQVWAEFTRELQQRQPVTFLFWSEDMAGVGPRLRGVEMDVRSKIVQIDEWWIPESMQR